MNKSTVFMEKGNISVYLKTRNLTYLCASLEQAYDYLKKERLGML